MDIHIFNKQFLFIHNKSISLQIAVYCTSYVICTQYWTPIVCISIVTYLFIVVSGQHTYIIFQVFFFKIKFKKKNVFCISYIIFFCWIYYLYQADWRVTQLDTVPIQINIMHLTENLKCVWIVFDIYFLSDSLIICQNLDV